MTDLETRVRSEDSYTIASTIPVFVGLVVGGLIVTVPASNMVKLLGVVVIGLTFLAAEMRAVKLVLLGIIVLEMPLQVDVYFGHDVLEAATGAISGYNVSLTTICLIALYGIWVTELIAGSARSPMPVIRRALPVIVYLAVVAASLVFATDTDLVRYEVVILAQAVLLMIYVAHAVSTRQELLFVIGLLLAGVFIQVGLSVLVLALGSTVEVGVMIVEIDGGRVAGTLGHPNSLGAYLAMLLPIAASFAIAPVASWFRWSSGFAVIAGSIVLAFTQSRGGFIGFVVGVVVLFALMYTYKLVSRPILVRGAAIALVPFAVQLAVIGARLLDFNNEAARSRLPLIGLATTIIGAKPIVGVGANNFAASLDQFLTIEYSAAWISTVHNKYLLVLSETGLIGFAAFLWFLFATLHRALEVVRHADTMLAIAAAGVLAGILAGMAHMVLDIYNGRSLVMLLLFLAGLVIALEKMSGHRAGRGSQYPFALRPGDRRAQARTSTRP